MARAKKENNEAVEPTEIKTAEQIENEQLKSQLAEMQEQIAKLMAMQIPTSQAPAKKSKRKVAFYNMLNHKVVFNGTKTHVLNNQFDSATFSESEAQAIVANTYNAIKKGYLYIADAQFVEDNDLDTIYETLLSNEQLKNLLSHDANYIVDIYKQAEAGQKKIIIDMLMEKKLNGIGVDANVLMQIGQLSGIDLLGVKPFED